MLEAYNSDRLLDRLRPGIRYLSCPFHALIDAVPKTGSVLDVGCGDGLFLRLLNRDSETTERLTIGIDPDPKKIKNAKLLNADAINFVCAEIGAMCSESIDCVTVVDVLYLLPIEMWHDFLRQCVRCLKPGGLLIVKEVHDRPRWKWLVVYAQELFSIYCSRMTQGDHPHFESIATYHKYIERAGCIVERLQPLDAGFLHAHLMFLARRH